MNAGTISPAQFFAPENVARIMADARHAELIKPRQRFDALSPAV
jgi:hypothetical protein